MSKEAKTYFTLMDGKVITYPLMKGEPNPDILEVRINYKRIDRDGTINRYSDTNTAAIHVPESLFKEHGLCLTQEERKEAPQDQPTIEDLLLQLLELCGVYNHE